MRATGDLSPARDGEPGLGNGCVVARNEFQWRCLANFDVSSDQTDAVAVDPAFEIAAQTGGTAPAKPGTEYSGSGIPGLGF